MTVPVVVVVYVVDVWPRSRLRLPEEEATHCWVASKLLERADVKTPVFEKTTVASDWFQKDWVFGTLFSTSNAETVDPYVVM